MIIGILAAVAIPSYQGFQNKAKGAEAKVALSAIYSAEKAYYAEETAYSNNLKTIGIPAESSKYYLAIGFKDADGSVVTVSNVATYGTGKVHTNCIVTTAAAANGISATAAKFKACAQRVASTSFTDTTDWWINEIKELKNDAL